MERIQTLLVSAVLLILFLGNSGCIFSPDHREDGSFLEPIPEETLQAFQFGSVIQTRLQAVIAARREMGAKTVNFTGTPQVVSVEAMKYTRAISRVREIASLDYPGNKKVWLVVFLCEIPLPSPTPDQSPGSSQNCTFVILDAQDGHALLLGSNPDCKSLYEW